MNYSGQSLTHEVKLPENADSFVSTKLQCDIQPGSLRQRYSVQWIVSFTNNNSVDILVDLDMFTLTLNVSSSTNGSQYQCHVTIDHDGNGTTITYEGRNIVVIISEGIPFSKVKHCKDARVVYSTKIIEIWCSMQAKAGDDGSHATTVTSLDTDL